MMNSAPVRTSRDASALIRKLWQYCNVLRDDGLSYPDYVEQLTYLLFLKMSDEQHGGPVPPEFGWASLVGLDAPSMQTQYSQSLAELGRREGMLGLIFRNARNKIKDPAKLRFLIVDLIDQTEWQGLATDVKGEAYEGLLEKNARDTKSGAGQYFTPRPLIEAIVECVNPQRGEVVCDPACGTGGFLLASHLHMTDQTSGPESSSHGQLPAGLIRGVELVEEVARLAAMNLLLHGVATTADESMPITCADSLKQPPAEKVDIVFSNPPFGTKGSVTYAYEDRRAASNADELRIIRPDFWVQTANKQLNFLQHIYTLLRPGGRAAVILPDNVLFERGAASMIRRRLLEECDVHTLLRLPTGLFYAQGVKANVLFFDRIDRKDSNGDDRVLWAYDLRSESRFTLKTRPMRHDDLEEFVSLYQPADRSRRVEQPGTLEGTRRWESFKVRDVLSSPDCSLDFLRNVERQASAHIGLDRLEEISRLISDDLHRALKHVSNATESH